MTLIKNTVLTLMLMLCMPLSYAADLTAGDIEKWLKAMPVLTAWLDQHEDKLDADDVMNEAQTMDQVFDKGVQQLRATGLYDDFNRQAKKQGYDSVEQWANVSREISMAYMAIEMEGGDVSLSQIEAQLTQLQQAEGIPDDQKAMMEEMMKASLLMLKATQNVSDGNKKVVRQYADKITAQFNAGDDDGHNH